MIIVPAQIRAARALVGWTQAELAAASGLSEMSIKNIERSFTDPRASTLSAIVRALEAAGVAFTNGGEPGVKARKFKPGDGVRFRPGSLEVAEYGDDVGVVVRERSDIPLGGSQWVDVDFPGKRSLIGTQTGRLEFAGLRIIRRETPIDNRYTEDHEAADEHWPVKRS
jgi:transcriptional regulator with XRE-family HTH domain